VQFPPTTLGTYSTPIFPVPQKAMILGNDSGSIDTIDLLSNDLTFSGPGANDYVLLPGNCPGNGRTTIVLPGFAVCNPVLEFFPGAVGDRSATMTIQGSADATGTSISLQGSGTIGYYQVDEFGDVANYGDAAWYGDTGNDNLNSPIVGMAPTGDDGGYWLVASDGGVFNFGPSAGFFGSAGAIPLNKPIVGMAAPFGDAGYWLVASDGGIFSYGDAPFYGSTGAIHLNEPIVGMAATPDGKGYWLVASDGGIFSYGDAQFFGSTGAIHLNQPIVGMASAPDGNGYWMVASDGGVFAFGPSAPFHGSAGALNLAEPISAMAAMPDASGYWFSANDGGLFNYGGAPFYGSGVNNGNLDVVVDMATDGEPTLQAFYGQPALRTPAERARVPRFAGPSRRPAS
jgi:hypothetical protein